MVSVDDEAVVQVVIAVEVWSDRGPGGVRVVLTRGKMAFDEQACLVTKLGTWSHPWSQKLPGHKCDLPGHKCGLPGHKKLNIGCLFSHGLVVGLSESLLI